MAETKTDNLEREYMIPLRHRWKIVPRYKRTSKAVKAVKEFLVRHMKVRDRDLNKIKIDKYLNEVLWSRGIRSPPPRIKVRAIREGDIIRAELAELPESIKFKKLRMEKVESSAKEIAKKRKAEKTETEAPETKPEESAEKKVEEQEKKEATVEAEQKIEKAAAVTEKHTTKVKPMREEKAREKKVYNKSSRGH